MQSFRILPWGEIIDDAVYGSGNVLRTDSDSRPQQWGNSFISVDCSSNQRLGLTA